MHILLLNQYYPPDTSATANMARIVAEKLAERHDVTVLSGRPSYDPEEFYPRAWLHTERQGGVTVERVGSTAYSRHKMRRRVANYLTFSALAFARALAIRADALLTMTDPPFAGILGAAIARTKKILFIYNIRDLYPEMAIGGEIVRPRKWVSLWEKMHRNALLRADRVIVLGEDMRERILAKGISAGRVTVIRDGADLPSAAPTNHPAIDEIRGGAEFVVLHAGNLGFYGAWDSLLQAARMLPRNGVHFVFVGDGANKAQLESQSRGLGTVQFLPFRPANEIPCVMAAGDMHVVTIRRGLEGVVVPSKMYSILAAGRPILAVAPDEADVARIVREFKCGLVADPDKPREIAAAIQILRSDPQMLAEMGARARQAALRFRREDELAKFLMVMDQIAHSQFQLHGVAHAHVER